MNTVTDNHTVTILAPSVTKTIIATSNPDTRGPAVEGTTPLDRHDSNKPDLAIGDAADGLDAATVAALVAGGEARRQAAEGAFRPEDDIAEFVRERTLGEEPQKTPAGAKPPAAAVAAAPPLWPVVSQ